MSSLWSDQCWEAITYITLCGRRATVPPVQTSAAWEGAQTPHAWTPEALCLPPQQPCSFLTNFRILAVLLVAVCWRRALQVRGVAPAQQHQGWFREENDGARRKVRAGLEGNPRERKGARITPHTAIGRAFISRWGCVREHCPVRWRCLRAHAYRELWRCLQNCRSDIWAGPFRVGSLQGQIWHKGFQYAWGDVTWRLSAVLGEDPSDAWQLVSNTHLWCTEQVTFPGTASSSILAFPQRRSTCEHFPWQLSALTNEWRWSFAR